MSGSSCVSSGKKVAQSRWLFSWFISATWATVDPSSAGLILRVGVNTCHWVLSGFVKVRTLASAHALHLPTNSVQVFQVGLNFWSWMKSESSLHMEKQGDEARESSAFRLAFRWGWKGWGAGV